MKTRTAPWDYERTRRVRKPVDVNICTVCGNYVIETPNGTKCLTCTNTEYVKVPEYLVDTVRCGLVMIQWEAAIHIARQAPNIGGSMQLNWEGK